MIWSNFLYRVGQWLRENEQRIIKTAVIIFAAILIVFLIFYAAGKWQSARYEKRVQALEAEFREADQKAKDAEARADVLKRAIDDKYGELQFLEARASDAENKLRNAKEKVVTLKERYETIRYTPMPVGPVSCADACAELAAVGYPCK